MQSNTTVATLQLNEKQRTVTLIHDPQMLYNNNNKNNNILTNNLLLNKPSQIHLWLAIDCLILLISLFGFFVNLVVLASFTQLDRARQRPGRCLESTFRTVCQQISSSSTSRVANNNAGTSLALTIRQQVVGRSSTFNPLAFYRHNSQNPCPLRSRSVLQQRRATLRQTSAIGCHRRLPNSLTTVSEQPLPISVVSPNCKHLVGLPNRSHLQPSFTHSSSYHERSFADQADKHDNRLLNQPDIFCRHSRLPARQCASKCSDDRLELAEGNNLCKPAVINVSFNEASFSPSTDRQSNTFRPSLRPSLFRSSINNLLSNNPWLQNSALGTFLKRQGFPCVPDQCKVFVRASQRPLSTCLRLVISLVVADFLRTGTAFVQASLNIAQLMSDLQSTHFLDFLNSNNASSISHLSVTKHNACTYVFLDVLLQSAGNAILLSLCSLALDLQLGLVYPTNYPALVNQHRVSGTLASLWFIAISFGCIQVFCPPFIVHAYRKSRQQMFAKASSKPYSVNNFCQFYWRSNSLFTTYYLLSSIVLLFALIVVPVSYGLAYVNVRRKTKHFTNIPLSRQYSPSPVTTRFYSTALSKPLSNDAVIGISRRPALCLSQRQRYQRGLCTTLVLFTCFLAVYLPNYLLDLTSFLMLEWQAGPPALSVNIRRLNFCLSLIGAIIDPFIYARRMPGVRHAMHSLFQVLACWQATKKNHNNINNSQVNRITESTVIGQRRRERHIGDSSYLLQRERRRLSSAIANSLRARRAQLTRNWINSSLVSFTTLSLTKSAASAVAATVTATATQLSVATTDKCYQVTSDDYHHDAGTNRTS